MAATWWILPAVMNISCLFFVCFFGGGLISIHGSSSLAQTQMGQPAPEQRVTSEQGSLSAEDGPFLDRG